VVNADWFSTPGFSALPHTRLTPWGPTRPVPRQGCLAFRGTVAERRGHLIKAAAPRWRTACAQQTLHDSVTTHKRVLLDLWLDHSRILLHYCTPFWFLLCIIRARTLRRGHGAAPSTITPTPRNTGSVTLHLDANTLYRSYLLPVGWTCRLDHYRDATRRTAVPPPRHAARVHCLLVFARTFPLQALYCAGVLLVDAHLTSPSSTTSPRWRRAYL